MSTLSIRDLDLKGKRVFMRVDFNVPLAPGGKEITSDKRIRRRFPAFSTRWITARADSGEPPGPSQRQAESGDEPGAGGGAAGGTAGQAGGDGARLRRPGRWRRCCRSRAKCCCSKTCAFTPEEEKNDPEFSKQLAALCDVYVNDAFGSAHRAHASTVGMIAFVKQAAAGLLMDKELEYLTKATQNPARPCVAILGGAKVSDKIEVIQNLMKVVDRLLIGGAMAYTFLRARGEGTGKSLVEEDKIDLARELMAEAGAKLMLPVDHVVAAELKAGRRKRSGRSGSGRHDGARHRAQDDRGVSKVIAGAKTIIWNGPMGVFEMPPFDTGTVALAKAVAASGAVSVVGGGDSEKAIKSAGVADKISAHLDRRRRVAGISGGNRTAGRSRVRDWPQINANKLKCLFASGRPKAAPSY